jgi:hypothetical protein
MTEAPMPADIAATPVGEAMRFVMEQIRFKGSGPLAAYLARFTPDYAAVIKEAMGALAAEAGQFTVIESLARNPVLPGGEVSERGRRPLLRG